MMNEDLIRDLAITGGIYDCICDPYDKLKNGDPYSSVMVDLERFAEKIVRECIRKIEDIAESSNDPQPIYRVAVELLEHFGVEE